MFRILVIGILMLSICSVRVSKAFPAKISSPGYFKDRFEFITQNENNNNPKQNLEPTMKPKPNQKVYDKINIIFLTYNIWN